MKMDEREFRNELAYDITMLYIREMMARGVISTDEYWVIDTKMKAKYLPLSDGLIAECALLSVQKRA